MGERDTSAAREAQIRATVARDDGATLGVEQGRDLLAMLDEARAASADWRPPPFVTDCPTTDDSTPDEPPKIRRTVTIVLVAEVDDEDDGDLFSLAVERALDSGAIQDAVQDANETDATIVSATSD